MGKIKTYFRLVGYCSYFVFLQIEVDLCSVDEKEETILKLGTCILREQYVYCNKIFFLSLNSTMSFLYTTTYRKLSMNRSEYMKGTSTFYKGLSPIFIIGQFERIEKHITILTILYNTIL